MNRSFWGVGEGLRNINYYIELKKNATKNVMKLYVLIENKKRDFFFFFVAPIANFIVNHIHRILIKPKLKKKHIRAWDSKN